MVKNGERTRRPSGKRIVRLTISLPAEDYRRLADEARELRVSLAWVIRRAVSAFVPTAGGKRRA